MAMPSDDPQAFPSSLTETLVYDAAKRPVSISLGSAGSLSQTYGRAGRVTSDSRSLNGITGDAGGGTQSFTYDGLGRLTGSTGLTSGARSYTYDLDANRLTRLEAAVTTTFTYDRTDEVVNQVIGGTTKTFASDPFGNQTTAADANSLLTSYAYDEASRLTTITPPSGSPATFAVDALDRPKTRTVGAAVDTYGYLGASKTTYETGTGSTDALLDASGARLAVKTGGTVSFALFDLHGSLVGLCTAGGSTISDAYRYDAFGQTLVASGSAVNPWRYRGLLDVSSSATPLYAMGARFYSPMLGSFTAEDSVAGRAADPLSMNRYLYAEADPTTLIDPDGHNACGPYDDYCTVAGKTVANSYATTTTTAKLSYCQRYAVECRRTGYGASAVGSLPPSWRPLSLGQLNGMSNGGLLSYARRMGANAYLWLQGHKGSGTTEEKYVAWVIAMTLMIQSDKGRVALASGGLELGSFISPDQALRYATSAGADFGLAFAVAGIGAPTAGGLTDNLPGLGRSPTIGAEPGIAPTDLASDGLRPIVIGENVPGRVRPFADLVDADVYVPGADPVGLSPGELKAYRLEQNRAWLRARLAEGREVYDMGIDPVRTIRSDYYAMESEEVLPYMNYTSVSGWDEWMR